MQSTVWQITLLRKLNDPVAKLTVISTVTSCITILTILTAIIKLNYFLKKSKK